MMDASKIMGDLATQAFAKELNFWLRYDTSGIMVCCGEVKPNMKTKTEEGQDQYGREVTYQYLVYTCPKCNKEIKRRSV